MYLGIDIGATTIKGVLLDGTGKTRRCLEMTTPKNKRRFMHNVWRFAKETAGNARIKGVGVGAPGQIDPKKGIVVHAPNLKFLSRTNLVSVFKRHFNVLIRIDNDARCFLRAESRYGAGRGKKNLVALTLGSGVGGALMIDGELLYGTNFSAGEIGHSFVNFPKTVESLGSKKFFSKISRRLPLEIQQLAEHGSPHAKKIYKTYGEQLGLAVADLINILNPDAVILGGGLARGQHLFLAYTKRIAARYVVNPKAKKTPILTGKLGSIAGAIGAALLCNKH